MFTTEPIILKTFENAAPSDCIPDIKFVLNLRAEIKFANTVTTEFMEAIKSPAPVPNFMKPPINLPNIVVTNAIVLPNNLPALLKSINRTLEFANFWVNLSTLFVTLVNV